MVSRLLGFREIMFIFKVNYSIPPEFKKMNYENHQPGSN